MSLQEQLSTDVKTAMKAREAGKLKLQVLRMVMASIKNKEIATREHLTDEDVIDVLAKEMKLRQESLVEFEKAGRDQQVEVLKQEISILNEYLPEQMDEADIRRLAKNLIAEVGAQSPKDTGKVMAVLMPKVKGKADGKIVNKVVRELLS